MRLSKENLFEGNNKGIISRVAGELHGRADSSHYHLPGHGHKPKGHHLFTVGSLQFNLGLPPVTRIRY
ncbi:hypothetical protein M1437_04800 [Patescibacteria group bacterium]|nr:hypothetical protein [Patescibacteria group bacterium]